MGCFYPRELDNRFEASSSDMFGFRRLERLTHFGVPVDGCADVSGLTVENT